MGAHAELVVEVAGQGAVTTAAASGLDGFGEQPGGLVVGMGVTAPVWF
ncbi:hypothetical protein ACK8N7_01540 [Streptomyces griseobrunneus]